VAIARRVLALDDEEFPAARFAPFAAEDLCRIREVWGEPFRLASRTRRVRATWRNHAAETIGQ
jgi:hypothetical protein